MLRRAMMAGGGGSWTFADLAVPPKLWANDASSVTDAGSGACQQWNDLTANGWHFVAASAPGRPTIVGGELAGRRVLRFDGSANFLQVAQDGPRDLFRNIGAGWCFLVYRKRGADGAASSRTIFSALNGTDGSSRFIVNVQGSAAVGKPALFARRADGDSTSVLNGATDAGTAWRMMLQAVDWANGDGAIHLDGESDASSTSFTSNGLTSDTASATFIGIGAYRGGGGVVVNHSDVDIAEVVIGSGSLPSAPEIDKMFGRAAHYWALTGNLDAGHPYKSAPP